MHVTPTLILDGEDVSRYFISAHCEMTANASKDPGKYDLVLANVGGRFLGSFAPKSYEDQTVEDTTGYDKFGLAPKHKVSLTVRVHGEGCESGERTVTIFNGEIQKAEADEVYLKIEGSCTQGGMTSSIKWTHIWDKDHPIVTIVNDLLDDFGIDGERHIYPAKNYPDDVNPKVEEIVNFDTAMADVAAWAESIYFFDENDDFWFIPATSRKGFSNLDGYILRGSNATNMVGYCNHVIVFGGTVDSAGESINERKTHNTIFWEAKAPAEEIQAYGLLTAPPITIHDATPERCKEVAEKLLEWFRQYKDVPTIKVVGKAPGLMSKVAYRPWNGSMPPVSCLAGEEASIDYVYGLVTRRVVDISAEAGFVCTLDVTTNFQGVNKPDADQDIYNFYSDYQHRLDEDDEIDPYGGVLFV